MAAISRAPAGRGQGHSHRPHRTSSRGDLTVVDTELENSGRTPSHHGRFLKVCDGNSRGIQRCQMPGSSVWAGSSCAAQSTLGSASHRRLSSVLDKVAQLESKIIGQKKHLELQNTDSGLKPLAEECTSSASGHEGGARTKKYWKNYGATSGNGTRRDACSEENTQSPKRDVTVKQQLDLDSDEEEMRELMESSLGFSSGNGNQKVLSKTPVPSASAPPFRKEVSPAELSKASSFHDKDSEKSVFGRVNSPAPSPPSRNLSGHTGRSRLLSSSMKDNPVKIALPKAGCTKQRQESLESDRSEIKSLDELFSKGSDAEDPTSSSSNDFRLNILSLDDLAPDTTSKAAESKQKGKDMQFAQESNKYVKKDTLLVEEDQAALKMTSVVTGVSRSSEEDIEKCVSEAEISEHLSGVSSDFPPHKQDERTLNSEYSEDFEQSLSTTDGESVEGRAGSCTCSGARPSPVSSPLVTQEQHSQGHQVTVTEAAVQTAEPPPFTYCWAKANPSAVLGPAVGTTYIDPVPIASHTISMDAVEALTAYSPSVLVLHTMCKQHLMLTQQFVENIHHLHTSLVESLEREKFHYHTLEEAKEYIKNHKSPPLTIEQALEEIRRAQEK
uniref:Chromosome 19 open reading frame 44 n=1 Tax=Cyanoderma ruficeps TaxID=181631 RepID=A0A8C3XF64_9PASS